MIVPPPITIQHICLLSAHSKTCPISLIKTKAVRLAPNKRGQAQCNTIWQHLCWWCHFSQTAMSQHIRSVQCMIYVLLNPLLAPPPLLEWSCITLLSSYIQICKWWIRFMECSKAIYKVRLDYNLVLCRFLIPLMFEQKCCLRIFDTSYTL